MTSIFRHRPGYAVAVAVLSAGAVLPITTASVAAADRTALPPGVIQLNDGEDCPSATLCLYRDYGQNGPAYGIGAGYDVDLSELPMAGGSGSAAGNVSSWVNRTDGIALLVDRNGQQRPLFPGQLLEEPSQTNDSVAQVNWA